MYYYIAYTVVVVTQLWIRDRGTFYRYIIVRHAVGMARLDTIRQRRRRFRSGIKGEKRQARYEITRGVRVCYVLPITHILKVPCNNVSIHCNYRSAVRKRYFIGILI